MPDQQEIQAASVSPKVQHIWCSVGITKKMEDVLIGFMLGQIRGGENISEYIFYLSTSGGNPFSAINLYNFMQTIPQQTTVYNMGSVASAGVTFFLGFKTRIGVPDCSFMVHQTSIPRGVLPENVTVSDLETQRNSLWDTDQKTQKIILKETASHGTKNLTKAGIKKDFLNSTIYHSDDAVQYGFIDRIETPTMPETGMFFLTDQFLATLAG